MDIPEFEIGRAFGGDFDQVVSLQNRNSVTALSEDQRGDGFLRSAFTAAQFEEMAQSVAIIVARDAGEVVGFVCASTVEHNRDNPLVVAMIDRFPQISLGSQSLKSLRGCIAGPVCVDKNYRGQGLFELMYARLFEEAASDYDAVLAFVSTANTRSVAAHQKVSMNVVDTFQYVGRDYFIVARLIR